LQAVAALAFRVARQELAQAPDRRVQGAAGALGVELGPEQVGKPFAPMRATRIGEQETRKAAAGRPKLGPGAIINTGRTEYSKQSDIQHCYAPKHVGFVCPFSCI
jgi:hypothetical protein